LPFTSQSCFDGGRNYAKVHRRQANLCSQKQTTSAAKTALTLGRKATVISATDKAVAERKAGVGASSGAGDSAIEGAPQCTITSDNLINLAALTPAFRNPS